MNTDGTFIVFHNEQTDYDRWGTTHPDGYVGTVCTHNPIREDAGIHRARCSTIRQDRRGYDYTRELKVCAVSRETVEKWLDANGYRGYGYCRHCQAEASQE